jgi:Fur family ferric uptake transcriptional regulator
METVENFLKKINLRVTESRVQILSFFQDQEFALSHADIESALSGKFDRVTIYRTLKSFLEKGLIHKVLDDSGNLKYAICTHSCSPEVAKHQHQHAHFKCAECGLTTCLDEVQIPTVNLPKGFALHESNLLVQGICADCGKVLSA